MLLASAIAFRLFLWLLPLSLLTAGILSVIAAHTPSSVTSASKEAGITGAASQTITTALREGNRSAWVAIVVGLLLFLWTSRTLIRSLMVATAHLWAAPPPRTRQKHLVITALMWAGCCLVLVAFSLVASHLDKGRVGVKVAAFALVAAGASGMWLLICLRLPDRRRSWTDLIPGGVLFGVGYAVLHAVSRLYLPHRFSHSSRLYGALGISAVILFWMLIIGQLIVVCSLINVVWSDYSAARQARSATRRGEQPAGAGAD
jgi:uncharacterized BrkB/YihY/UPF0761 family membrane protein